MFSGVTNKQLKNQEEMSNIKKGCFQNLKNPNSLIDWIDLVYLFNFPRELESNKALNKFSNYNS